MIFSSLMWSGFFRMTAFAAAAAPPGAAALPPLIPSRYATSSGDGGLPAIFC
jgi:hypothetical protein